MARWTDDAPRGCFPRPCPDCQAPHGCEHRPGCLHDPEVLAARLAPALRPDLGVETFLDSLAVLATDSSLWWWELQRKGISVGQLQKALHRLHLQALRHAPGDVPELGEAALQELVREAG